MAILRWLERTRRRWSGGLDPDELDRVATDFAKRASQAEAGASPGFAALRQIDGLFEVWLAAFRRDLRLALTTRSRNDQLLALRRNAGEYLRRSNDGWRVLAGRRLAGSERALVLQLRRAPASAQALHELGETAKRVPPRTLAEGTTAAAVLTLRHNELVSDGLLGHLSVILLEGLVKTFFNEELLTEDATRSMDVSDLQHLLQFKALGHSRTEDRRNVGQVVIENYVANCLEGVAHALERRAPYDPVALIWLPLLPP